MPFSNPESVQEVKAVTQPTVEEPIVFPTEYTVPSTGVSVTADVLLKTKLVLKSESGGFVQLSALSVSPGVTEADVTFAGEVLSIVMVAEEESDPA